MKNCPNCGAGVEKHWMAPMEHGKQFNCENCGRGWLEPYSVEKEKKDPPPVELPKAESEKPNP